MKLHIDIETFSSLDLKKVGAYKYFESPDFQILLLAFAFGEEPIQVVDLANGEKLPKRFLEGYYSPNVTKCAYNANFERGAFRAVNMELPTRQWECTAVKSAYCGLPLSLDMASQVLNLGEKGKQSTGKALIRYFCQPCKPTKSNGNRVRNFPEDDPEKWEDFKEYCKFDVEAERGVDEKLDGYLLPVFEKENYYLDQEINDRGVAVDPELIKQAIKIDDYNSGRILEEMKEITGCENPNSPGQLKEWLSEAMGESITSLAKEKVEKLISETDPGTARDVLKLRQKSSKSSIKKYVAMENSMGEDGRIRGLLQFYGANRTGRWAGRLVQIQNLPRNKISTLDMARSIVKRGDLESLKLCYANPSSVLSQLIRTAFIPPKGHLFAVSDFSAIEARVIAWLADEKWRLDVFNSHGKIYEASAAAMFKVPIESVTKESSLRFRGKVSELALGYQGGTQALARMAEIFEIEIPAQERQELVNSWRAANPNIVKLWYDVEKLAKKAILTGQLTFYRNGLLKFHSDSLALTITLPSGKELFYIHPRIKENRFGRPGITYEGIEQTSKKWGSVETYGGKLIENIVQAISRDLLAYSMLKLKKEEFKIVMHIHDEVVIEVHKNEAKKKLKEIENIMGENVPWAPGLPLAAEGFISEFYKKD